MRGSPVVDRFRLRCTLQCFVAVSMPRTMSIVADAPSNVIPCELHSTNFRESCTSIIFLDHKTVTPTCHSQTVHHAVEAHAKALNHVADSGHSVHHRAALMKPLILAFSSSSCTPSAFSFSLEHPASGIGQREIAGPRSSSSKTFGYVGQFQL
jgi:hypothetical protein